MDLQNTEGDFSTLYLNATPLAPPDRNQRYGTGMPPPELPDRGDGCNPTPDPRTGAPYPPQPWILPRSCPIWGKAQA